MTMHEFHQRVVVVTGASGNLGRAVAQAFARHGAHLALLDRDAAGCEALIADLSGQTSAQVFEVDLIDPASTDRAIADVVDAYGRIDVLANIAGGAGPRHLHQIDEFEDTATHVLAEVDGEEVKILREGDILAKVLS